MNVILIYWLMPWINTPKRGRGKGKKKKKSGIFIILLIFYKYIDFITHLFLPLKHWTLSL